MKYILHKLPSVLQIVVLFMLMSSKPVLAGDPCTAPYLNFPIHDTCFSGTTVGSTTSGISTFPCSATNNGEVWYKFTAPSCNPMLIVQFFQGGSPGRLTGVTFYLYSGSCTNLSLLDCMPSMDTIFSDTITSVAPNDTVFIRVKAIGSDGSFDICIYKSCLTEVTNIVTEQSLDIWPNPISGELNYRFSVPSVYALRLYDITGRMLMNVKKEENSAEGSLDLSGLSSGVYLLQAQADGIVYTRKIVKE